MDAPDLTFERAARAGGATLVAGVDEVGRGPWAGPVLACAAALHGPPPPGLGDSKALTARRRAALVGPIREAAHLGIGRAEVAEIDRLGIAAATRLAMARAVAALPVPPDHLLIDGRDRHDWCPCPFVAIVRGDARSASIAAASIVAKQARDALMVSLAQRFPGYGWDTNMGYGTPVHRAGLHAQGVTPHHRRSFAPIRDLLRPRL
ncbi:ribonuclease HII [Jannaschia sp. LMIT008]|uniref:ribonuclease HII n=1 Tax=Jannaschia maritima TaxID=3032585 RepID=UPI0028116D24|nr:ribonuclease HII [Jannaschia sp. LMIT008]